MMKIQKDLIMIPKIAHLIWMSPDDKTPLPKHWQPTVDNWHKYHPDWEINVWNENTAHAFVRKHASKQYQKLFFGSEIKLIQRVDMLRPLLLFHLGGFYMDLSEAPITSLSPLIKMFNQMENDGESITSALLGESAVHQVHHKLPPFTNAIMAGEKNSPFFKLLLKNMCDEKKRRGIDKFLGKISNHFKIISTFGPSVLNSTYHEFIKQNDNPHKVRRIPNTFLQFKKHWQDSPVRTDTGLVEVLKGGSWQNQDSRNWTNMDCFMYHRDYWLPILTILLLVIVVILSVFVHKLK
jgi:mannosyltransferase OCH1-like enzyme